MHHDGTRAIIEISGDDRQHFLQGIITQDIHLLRADRGLFAALLSPQGKILHDFFLIPHGASILLDCDAAQKETLRKRLTMYKLRADVRLEDGTGRWRVAYRTQASSATIGHVTPKKNLLAMTDPRAAELGERLYITDPAATPKNTVPPERYHRHRIALGIPDGAWDIAEDVALDAGYDALNAVSFSKGCYVGQEVTARMHYKQIARRGFYIVEGAHPLPERGTPLIAAGITLGELRGGMDACGLAMLKFDAAETARAAHHPIMAGAQAVEISTPAWLQPKLAQFRAARETQ